MYICECGKEFDNPQKFNGHKTHCIAHLQAVGKYEKYILSNKQRGEKSSNSLHEKNLAQKELKLATWISEQHICEHCGKVMTEKFGSGRFCSRSCANARVHSEKTKQKISSSLQKSDTHDQVGNLLPVSYCLACKKPLFTKTKYGYCLDCFKYSDSCFNIRSKISLSVKDKLHSENRVFGFTTRNLTSYPEKFWIKVLDNNSIKYEHEYKVINDHNCCYFLDFLITIAGKKIDLEIDGAQHLKEDRKESDEIRDKYLSDNGYVIYRVPWNEIKTEKGKNTMKEKIDNFLSFYNSLLETND